MDVGMNVSLLYVDDWSSQHLPAPQTPRAQPTDSHSGLILCVLLSTVVSILTRYYISVFRLCPCIPLLSLYVAVSLYVRLFASASDCICLLLCVCSPLLSSVFHLPCLFTLCRCRYPVVPGWLPTVACMSTVILRSTASFRLVRLV